METVELGADDAAELTALYREYGWWADRDRESVETAVSNTALTLGVRDGGDLVASARVVTDFTYYARVHDVVVAANRRGEGIGRRLVSTLADDERLAGVNLVLLCREGLVPFYESVGFEPYPDTVAAPEADEVRLRQLVHTNAGRDVDDGPADEGVDDEKTAGDGAGRG